MSDSEVVDEVLEVFEAAGLIKSRKESRLLIVAADKSKRADTERLEKILGQFRNVYIPDALDNLGIVPPGPNAGFLSIAEQCYLASAAGDRLHAEAKTAPVEIAKVASKLASRYAWDALKIADVARMLEFARQITASGEVSGAARVLALAYHGVRDVLRYRGKEYDPDEFLCMLSDDPSMLSDDPNYFPTTMDGHADKEAPCSPSRT